MFFTVLKKRNLIRVLCITLALAVCCFILPVSGAYNAFYANPLRRLPIYSVDTENKVIAISFDCAWGVDYTYKLLDIMQEENVKCTFFCVQFWTEKYPEYVKKISDYGHEIGTHSATHPYMSKLDKSTVERELTTSKNAIENITGKRVEVFRPPYGDYNNLLIDTAESLGLYTIQWSVDSLDWKDISATEIRKRVVGKVKNGSIVLFHNQGLHTAQALRDIIKDLKAKGYEFTQVGNLIYKDNYKINADGTQTRL